jgi:hypothetical protein
MAKKEIALEIKIEAANSAKTLGEMKSSLKALVAEQQNVVRGSKDWERLSKAINDAEGKIGDLTDSFSTLKGSGIERASSSLGLLREGITNLDFEKVKIGLGGVKAALAATGIMLFVQGITALIENFDELKNSGGVIGQVFTKIGEGIDWVLEKLEVFGDWIGLIDKDLNDMSEAIDKNAEKTKEALDAQSAAFDRQIKVAQSAGKSTVELEKAKQQAIIDTNLQMVKQIEAFVRAGGELDDQKKKLLTASLEAIKNAKTEEIVIENKAEQDKKKVNDEAYKRLQERHEKERQDLLKQQELAFKAAKDEEAWQDASLEYLNKTNALKLKQQEDYNKLELDAKGAVFVDTVEMGKKAYEEDKKNFEASEAAKKEALGKSLEAGQALTQAFFAFQLAAAKGNEAKELEIRKRMFQVDKAFNVARAVQDGIRSVQAALTIPPPGGQILAGVNAAIAAANVAKILATKFEGGGASATSAPSIPSGGAGGNNVPTINNAQTSAPIQSTSFDENGRNKNIEVVAKVYEGEMTAAQKRTDKINKMAEF